MQILFNFTFGTKEKRAEGHCFEQEVECSIQYISYTPRETKLYSLSWKHLPNSYFKMRVLRAVEVLVEESLKKTCWLLKFHISKAAKRTKEPIFSSISQI